jgi:hypothetical protein
LEVENKEKEKEKEKESFCNLKFLAKLLGTWKPIHM